MTSKRRHAFVGVGSNETPEVNIGVGLTALRRQFGDLGVSTTYASAERDGDGSTYHNLVVDFSTALNFSQLRAQLKSIEDQCGRRRGADAGGVVTLDLDLLILRGAPDQHDEFDLALEDLCAAPYILAPLAERLPQWLHPEAGRVLAELWSEVRKTTAALRVVRAARPGGADAARAEEVTS